MQLTIACVRGYRYEAAWGWNDAKKRKELFHEDARFIIAFERESRKPVAYVYLRFESEGNDLVLYVYV